MTAAATIPGPAPLPDIPVGMIVRVVYLGQQKIRYRQLDSQGRRETPEWWNGETWQDLPCVCTDPYVDERGKPKVMYDGIAYDLRCGQETFMPIEAARLWFGDERAVDSMSSGLDRRGLVAWVNDRPTEVRRLRSLYDNRMGNETVIVGHPIVEVYTIEANEEPSVRVPMVLDDPQGLNISPASLTQQGQADLLLTLKKQQAAIDQLRRQVEAQSSASRRQSPAPTPRSDVDTTPEPDAVPISSLPEDPNG